MAKLDLSSIDLSKLKKEYAVVILLILIIAIPFFYYKNIFQPIRSRIKDLSSQIEQKKQSIQRAKVGPEALEKLEKEIDTIKPRINYYQKKLKGQVNIPKILKELNQLAERLGIKFTSVNPQDKLSTPLPEGEETLVQIPIKIKMQCGYHELGQFINQIENLPRFMKVAELKIEADPQNVWSQRAELVITSFSLISNKKK